MEELTTCCLEWRGKWSTKWMRRLRGQNDDRQRSFAATNSMCRSPSPLLYSYVKNDNTDGSHPGQGEETSYSNTVPASSSATKEALSISAEEMAAGEDQTLPHPHGDKQASDFSGYVTSGNTALSDHPAETIPASQPRQVPSLSSQVILRLQVIVLMVWQSQALAVGEIVVMVVQTQAIVQLMMVVRP